MTATEKMREQFEQEAYKRYFRSAVISQQRAEVPATGLFLAPAGTLTRAELCERAGDDYKRPEVSAMWWAWSNALELAASQNSPSSKNINEAPWDDCRISFHFDCDEESIWSELDPKIKPGSLPSGWSLCSTKFSGNRNTAVFRVDHQPDPADGEKVSKVLRAIEMASTATLAPH